MNSKKSIAILELTSPENLLLSSIKIQETSESVFIICREDSYQIMSKWLRANNQKIQYITLTNQEISLLNSNEDYNIILNKLKSINQKYNKLYNLSYTQASFRLASLLNADHKFGPLYDQNTEVNDHNHFGQFFLAQERNKFTSPYSRDFLLSYYIDRNTPFVEKISFKHIVLDLSSKISNLDLKAWEEIIYLFINSYQTQFSILGASDKVTKFFRESDILIDKLNRLKFIKEYDHDELFDLFKNADFCFSYHLDHSVYYHYYNIPTIMFDTHIENIYDRFIINANFTYYLKQKDNLGRLFSIKVNNILGILNNVYGLTSDFDLANSNPNQFNLYMPVFDKTIYLHRVYGNAQSVNDVLFKLNQIILDFYYFDINRSLPIDSNLSKSTLLDLLDYKETLNLMRDLYLYLEASSAKIINEKNTQDIELVEKVNEAYNLSLGVCARFPLISPIFHPFIEKIAKFKNLSVIDLSSLLVLYLKEFIALLDAILELIEISIPKDFASNFQNEKHSELK